MSRPLANKIPLALIAAFALAATVAFAWTAASVAEASSGGASVPASPTAKTHAKGVRLKTRRGAQIATWFGPGFYGQKTACGQTMTPVIVGVASRTLPCGTLVLVSYDGHSLTVPVIDRGPYSNGATWDLTWGAASALTISETVRVKTKIVGSAVNTPLLGAPAPSPLAAAEAASGGTAAV